MKNLKNYLIGGMIGAGSLFIGGCTREIKITPIIDINNDGYCEVYIEQPWTFGTERILAISNVIDGKITYSQKEIEKDSDFYKKYFENKK